MSAGPGLAHAPASQDQLLTTEARLLRLSAPLLTVQPTADTGMSINPRRNTSARTSAVNSTPGSRRERNRFHGGNADVPFGHGRIGKRLGYATVSWPGCSGSPNPMYPGLHDDHHPAQEVQPAS